MTKAQEDAAYYAVITAPVRYDPELSSTAKLLYCEITSLCKQKGYCWASNNHFAELFNLSPSTISRMVSLLERRGHIKTEIVAVANGSERRIYTDAFQVQRVENTAGEGGTQKPQDPPGGAQKDQGGVGKNRKEGVRKNRKQNDYQLNDHSEEDPPYSPPSSPEDCRTGRSAQPNDGPAAPDSGGLPTAQDKPTPGKGRRDKSMPAYAPDAFETFWTAYPRKDKRTAAIREWDKLKPNRELCLVMYRAMKHQCKSEQWAEADGKFIPMFSTWLHQRRWEDRGVDPSLLKRPRDTSGSWIPDKGGAK